MAPSPHTPEPPDPRSTCRICQAISKGGWVTPQTGEKLPPEFEQLQSFGSGERHRALRCPLCGGYFEYRYDTDNSPGICEYEGLWPIDDRKALALLPREFQAERAELEQKLTRSPA